MRPCAAVTISFSSSFPTLSIAQRYLFLPPRSRTILLILDGLKDRFLERLGLSGASPPLHNLAVLANKELLKVPLYALETHETGLLLLHPLEDGLGLVAVDFGFAQHGEGDAVV